MLRSHTRHTDNGKSHLATALNRSHTCRSFSKCHATKTWSRRLLRLPACPPPLMQSNITAYPCTTAVQRVANHIQRYSYWLRISHIGLPYVPHLAGQSRFTLQCPASRRAPMRDWLLSCFAVFGFQICMKVKCFLVLFVSWPLTP